MNKLNYLALLCALLFSPLAFSSDVVFFGSISDGGDKLAETDKDQDVRGGGLIQLSAGLENPISDDLVLQTMFGLKFDGVTASDGDASFIRYPIDVSLIKRTERFELSMGLTYHMNPKFDLNINGLGSAGVNFDNALGTTLGIGLRTNNISLGTRFTFIDYQTGNLKVDGNSLGLYCSINI